MATVAISAWCSKPRGSDRSLDAIRSRARELGIGFSIAVDGDWETLDTWWLRSGEKRTATSASFLLDKRGVIRFVHPGPELHPGGGAGHERCRKDFADLQQAIDVLLREPAV